MAFKFVLLASTVASVGLAQFQQGPRIDPFNFNLILNERETTTPTPILRYVDKQNSDGSYTYGYESGDGTYKIETRYATGEVKGKYGYYDPTGELREVEYGATPERGFEPSIEGLVLPPPAAAPAQSAQPAQVEKPVFQEPTQFTSVNFASVDNGVVVKDKVDSGRRVVVRRRRPEGVRSRPRARPVPAPAPAPAARAPSPNFHIFEPFQQRPVQPRPLQQRPFVPQQQLLQPSSFAASVALPQPDPNQFFGHPAQNINLQTGTYSISYSG